MQKRWKVLEEPPQSFYDEHPELPKVVAHLLYHRNLRTQEQIDEFLNPDYGQDIHDPFLFKDMEKTVARLFEAIEKNEKIIIHGDYDADGVSGSIVLSSLFKALDFHNFEVFLPHRETDGYGLNLKNVQAFADEGANIIISCDCGISNAEEVALANSLGLDVIITDHHSIPDKIPDAYAIIHPKIEDETYPDKGLAGGAVAFKLAQGMIKKHAEAHDLLPNGQKHEAFEKWQLDMVAISSVADMVPLVGESRTLTKYGLIVLNKTKRTGMQKLLLEARLMNDDGTMAKEIDADTIGFRIAPQINAAGRLAHANVAYELLATDDPTNAVDLAFQLDQNNKERQRLTKEYVEQAVEQVEREQKNAPFLFVIHENWTTGIVGLIASRIKDAYNKPTIAMGYRGEEITGSGRSIKGFNLIGAMQEIPECFSKFGGHPMACGFTLAGELEEMKKKLTEKFEEKKSEIDLTPTLDIDAEIQLEDVTWDLYDTLQKFEPFGMKNPKPTYLAKGVKVVKAEGMGKDKRHIRLTVSHSTPRLRKVVGWNLCSDKDNGKENWCTLLSPGDMIDMVFEISINEWNGNRELQLTLIDLKKTV